MFKKAPVTITADDFKQNPINTVKTTKKTKPEAEIITKEQYLRSKVVVDTLVEQNISANVEKILPQAPVYNKLTMKPITKSIGNSREDEILWIQ